MQNIPQTWQDSLMVGLTYTIEQFSAFLPRVIGSLLIILIGMVVAGIVKRLVVRGLEALRVSKAVEKTPLELFLKNADMGSKLEEIIGGLFYWLFLFVVLHTAVSVLGLTPLSEVMDRILSYIPHVFSAFLIFIFGVLLAGMVEGLVKGAMRSLDSYSALLFAKVASYLVVTIAILAAIAELGIATEFIRILFLGVTLSLSVGAGLALGLGGQDLVRKILNNWYERTKGK